MDSPAFPRLARWLTLALIVLLAVAAGRASPQLLQASWSLSSLLLMAGAWAVIAWLGYWIVHSRTRLGDDDVLVQTWIWDRRVGPDDVAQLKLVHLPLLEWLVAPRLLVRRRGGGVQWFHSADPALLREFGARVLRRQTERQRQKMENPGA